MIVVLNQPVWPLRTPNGVVIFYANAICPLATSDFSKVFSNNVRSVVLVSILVFCIYNGNYEQKRFRNVRSNLNIFHISHKFVDKQQALKIPWQYLYISRKKRSNVLYEMLKLYLWINSSISDISKNFILTAIIQH